MWCGYASAVVVAYEDEGGDGVGGDDVVMLLVMMAAAVGGNPGGDVGWGWIGGSDEDGCGEVAGIRPEVSGAAPKIEREEEEASTRMYRDLSLRTNGPKGIVDISLIVVVADDDVGGMTMVRWCVAWWIWSRDGVVAAGVVLGGGGDGVMGVMVMCSGGVDGGRRWL
ncbi:hypothetical protein Tco_0836649 [Tanacetum coccineum]